MTPQGNARRFGAPLPDGRIARSLCSRAVRQPEARCAKVSFTGLSFILRNMIGSFGMAGATGHPTGWAKKTCAECHMPTPAFGGVGWRSTFTAVDGIVSPLLVTACTLL